MLDLPSGLPMVKIATSERLAQVLHAAGLFDMERKARAFAYDDYKSESATPCIDLVNDLIDAGRQDLAERAKNGEWDATPEESDAWAASPDGQATLAQLPPEMRHLFEKKN